MRNLQLEELIGVWRSYKSNSTDSDSIFDFTITNSSEYEFFEFEKQRRFNGRLKLIYNEKTNTQIFSLSNYKEIELFMIYHSELLFIIDGQKYFFKKIN